MSSTVTPIVIAPAPAPSPPSGVERDRNAPTPSSDGSADSGPSTVRIRVSSDTPDPADLASPSGGSMDPVSPHSPDRLLPLHGLHDRAGSGGPYSSGSLGGSSPG